MQIRKDGRTPKMKDISIGGIPVVNNYKYLGVIFDDSLNFKEEIKTRNKKLKKLGDSKWLLYSNKFSQQSKLHIW